MLSRNLFSRHIKVDWRLQTYYQKLLRYKLVFPHDVSFSSFVNGIQIILKNNAYILEKYHIGT